LDAAVEQCLQSMLPVPYGSEERLSAEVLLQAQLPLRNGGLGLTSGERVAPLAFAAGFIDAARTLQKTNNEHLATAVTNYFHFEPTSLTHDTQLNSVATILRESKQIMKDQAHAARNFIATDQIKKELEDIPDNSKEAFSQEPKIQQRMCIPLHRALQASLKQQQPGIARTRLVATSRYGASAAFAAIPSADFFTIPNTAMSFKIAHHLGCPKTEAMEIDRASRCLCKRRPVTEIARLTHSLNCLKGGGPIRRHNLVAEQINSMFVTAGFSTTLEPRQHSDSGHAGPDIEVRGYPSVSQSTYVEVAVTNPIQPRFVNSQNPAAAAEAREADKIGKYVDYAKDRKHELSITIVEAYGGFGKPLKEAIAKCATNAKTLGRSLAGATWASPAFFPY
jgi:hypothetical protein